MTSTTASFIAKYKSILAKHLNDTEHIRDALSATTEHALWQDLADLVQTCNDDSALQALMDAVFHQFSKDNIYSLPAKAIVRASPKQTERLLKKLQPMAAHRSNFCDWMACRLQGAYDTFPTLKEELAAALSDDTVLVWRYDYDNPNDSNAPRDIMHQGYAYRPGAWAVMEIQVVEPIAAWVFSSNSLHKHKQILGRVTFKESKEIYEEIKSCILNNTKPSSTAVRDVKTFYTKKRQEKGDANPLDLGELAKLQEMINGRFSFDDGD